MFEIDENNLPIVRTRQALLVLDLQNAFVSVGGPLYVDEPPNFVENTTNIASPFRDSGNNVIWIRTVFETSRAVNLARGDSEKVITDEELPPGHCGDEDNKGARSKPSSKQLLQSYNKMVAASGRLPLQTPGLGVDEEEEEEETPITETYLTLPPGKKAQVVLAASTESNFSVAVSLAVDTEKDLFFQKSHYSAFKDGRLVQILRAKFVTEIYICGALTNISVFATAMDAARYGYTITILEDCIGYRSKARHDEALKQLVEFTGCDLITSSDLLERLQRKNKVQQPAQKRIHRPGPKDSSLEGLMSNLKLKPASSNPSRPNQVIIKSPNSDAPVTFSRKSDSQLPTEEAQSKTVEIDGKKRERVKTKIKTRRRPEPSSQNASTSSPATTLAGASQVLEKTPAATTKIESGPDHSSEDIGSDRSPSTQKTMPLRNKKEPRDGEIPGKSSKELLDEKEVTVPKTECSGPLCEGDTTVIYNVLNEELSQGIFELIRDEVQWEKMSHQGGDVPRLVAVQGEVAEDGSIPIYRHPADESPPLLQFSPTVSLIRKEVETKLGHTLNHVLIQFYRDGKDYISEHSDKTLDIVPQTFIANVSLGAQRTMVFRTKKDVKAEASSARQASRAPLPHNSLCKMGLVTNMRWLHAIKQDKRMESEKSEAELAYNGGRISLTFRKIGTFLDKNQQKIWGQGATSKSQKDAKTVINGNTPEAEKMIRAFGKENHSSEFNWVDFYGGGFDVLHISNSRKLFLSGDRIADFRVKMVLSAYNIDWVETQLSPLFTWKDGASGVEVPLEKLPVKFVDNDLSRSTVTGDLAIMLYLDAVYGSKNTTPKLQVELARQYTRFYQADNLLKSWRAVPFSVKPLRRELEIWDAFAAEGPFIAGSAISLADYALFSILDDMATEWGPHQCNLLNVRAFHERMKDHDIVKRAQVVKDDSAGQISS